MNGIQILFTVLSSVSVLLIAWVAKTLVSVQIELKLMHEVMYPPGEKPLAAQVDDIQTTLTETAQTARETKQSLDRHRRLIEPPVPGDPDAW